MNLHAMVRNAITTVHSDEQNMLYQSIEGENEEGKYHAAYEEPFAVMVQWQPINTRTAQLLRETTEEKSMTVYLHTTPDYPVMGIARIPLARSGDFLLRDGVWWLITEVVEDWSKEGWVHCVATLQVEPPEGLEDDT